MTEMKARPTALVTVVAACAWLVAANVLPACAEDAAPVASPAEPVASQAEPAVSVPRPSLVPKAAEPAQPAASTDPSPRRSRYAARRHGRRYAAWEPFPVYWPHLYRHRIYWNRIPWFAF
jgi:hypothetical protein